MFVRALNLNEGVITYQIVDKIIGKAMEPIKADKFTFHNKAIIFDKNRSLSFELVKYIDETLNNATT